MVPMMKVYGHGGVSKCENDGHGSEKTPTMEAMIPVVGTMARGRGFGMIDYLDHEG